MTCVGVICCTPVTLGQGRLTTTGTGAQLTSAARAEVMWTREHEAEAELYSAMMEEELSQVSEHREVETARNKMRTCNILTNILILDALSLSQNSIKCFFINSFGHLFK